MLFWYQFIINLFAEANAFFLLFLMGFIVHRLTSGQPPFPDNRKEWIIGGILMATIALINALPIGS